MSSEVVTFNDLRKVLELSGHSPSGYIHIDVPAAYMYGNSTTNTAVTTGTYYALNSFGGYTTTHGITNDDYFASDTNGFKVLREGIYRLAVTIHFNSASSTNVYSTAFYNYTTSTQLNSPRFFSDDARGYASGSSEWIGFIGANQIVLPRFCRYAGTSNMRPTDVVYSIILLHDPNAAELFQGGSSSGEVTDATATPTPNKVSKFDSDAFMNSEDMSNSDIEDFIEDLDLSGSGGSSGGTITNIADYVVEEGVNGDSAYRKWDSGIAECWIKTTQNVALNNTYGSLYQGTWDWSFPITFLDTPIVTCSYFKWGTGASWGTIAGVSGTDVTLRGIDVVSRASGSTIIHAYAIGKWK